MFVCNDVLGQVMGLKLPYDTIEGLRARIAEVAPGMTAVDKRQPALYLNGLYYKVNTVISM